MKNTIKKFSSFNENHDQTSSKFSVEVGKGWADEVGQSIETIEAKEIKAATDFEFVADAIKVESITAEITDNYNGAVHAIFTNSDSITYEMKQISYSEMKRKGLNQSAPPYSETILMINNKPLETDADSIVDRYLGSTDSLVGDILLIYRDFKKGKIK